MLVLDTHVWIWLVAGDPTLSAGARDAIEAAAADGSVLVPAISVWEVAVESCRLPGPFHHDPADRMIVATARIAGATLVTGDKRILDYGARGHVAVFGA